MAQPVRRACDACRKRKIRCTGRHPCTNCQEAELECRYQQLPRKKGRKGETANVLSELRAAQRQTPLARSSPHDALSLPSPSSLLSASNGTHHRFVPGTDIPRVRRWPDVPESPPNPDFVSLDVVHACIDFYVDHIRTTVPILDRPALEEELLRVGESIQSYCLIVSFCAYVIIQTGAAVMNTHPAFHLRPIPPGIGYGQELVEEALRARKYVDDSAAPSSRTILICFFLYGSFVGLGNQRRAWFFLREATTLFTVGPLHVEPGRRIHDAAVSNRLWWILLVSERSHAIRRRRPMTLQVTPESPPADDQAAEGEAISGFGYLIRLFRPFDESFFALWNRSQTVCTQDFLVGLELQVQAAIPPVLDLSNDELANLRVSQQWLRIMLWELFTLLGLLSSTSAHECLTFRHPLEIARDLTIVTWKLPHQSMEIHGVGMTEKIFDVACAVTDILSYIPSTRVPASGIELGPEDYLKHFCVLMSKLPGGQAKFVPLLLAKLGQLLPSMLTPIAQHLQLPVPTAEETVLTPDSAYLYDEEIRAQLNSELSRIGMETLESAVK